MRTGITIKPLAKAAKINKERHYNKAHMLISARLWFAFVAIDKWLNLGGSKCCLNGFTL